MITWLETIAPQTAWSESTIIARNAPIGFFPNTQNITITGFTNWSRTERFSSEIQAFPFASDTYSTSRRTYSVLGTTNSYSLNEAGANVSRDTTREQSWTVKDLFETTTTETTRSYTFSQVGETSSQTTVYTTSSLGSGKTTATTQQTETTIFTTATQSTQSTHIATTTFAGTILNTPMYATVVQAEANEIIWVAQTSAATSCLDISAASLVAQSTTKTTITPWTQTIQALSANPASTYTTANSVLSGSVGCQIPNWDNTMSTTVAFFEAIPQETEEAVFRTPVSLVDSTLNFTIFPAETLTVGQHETLTFVASRPTTISGYTAGSSFRETAETALTYTRVRQADTVGQYTSSDTGALPGWTGENSGTTERTRQQTNIAHPIQHLATFIETVNYSWIEGYHGVMDEDGSVAVGYSCAVNFGFIPEITASHSRNVVTLIPTQTVAADGQHDLTISGLSITYKALSATQTESTTIETFGTAERNFSLFPEFYVFSGLQPDGLGNSETAYRTTKRGAYWNESTTQSFSVVASSYTAGQSAGWLEPITGISAATTMPQDGGLRVGENQIWWTTSRNSHFSVATLSDAAAYSAP